MASLGMPHAGGARHACRRKAALLISALAVLVPPTFVHPRSGCGQLRADRRSRQTVAVDRRSGFLDALLQLPDVVTDAVDDVQDMLGQGAKDPLSMEVSSLSMTSDGVSKNGVLQTMSIRAADGAERRMARQVTHFVETAHKDRSVATVAANQSPEDPRDFMVLLRYPSTDKMMAHQASQSFKDSMEKLEPHLGRSIGLYLMDEQLGQLGMARHPFGPGGEGGRDDAIYSSRKQR